MPGIRFTNVRTKESVVVDTEPLISSYYNSSDLHVNARLGQDFGWRIAPELVVRIEDIRKDQNILREISRDREMLIENITDKDILHYISQTESRETTEREAQEDYTDEYEAEIKKLKEAKTAKKAKKEDSKKSSSKK